MLRSHRRPDKRPYPKSYVTPEKQSQLLRAPAMMIHIVNKMLAEEMGFRPEQNFVTLEARMPSGIGMYGRCNLGDKLV